MKTLTNRREWAVSVTKEDFVATVKPFGLPAKFYDELLYDNSYYAEEDSVCVGFKAGDFNIFFTTAIDVAMIEYGDWSKETKSKSKIRQIVDFLIELNQADEVDEDQDLELYRLYKSIK